MKKNLLYLFMLVCSVGLFTSCGDDDDDNNDKPDVAGTYAGNLGVTIDDSDPITSSQTIELTSPAETLVLYPFLLFSVARFSVLLLISFLFLISEYGTLLFLKYFR